MLLYGPRARGAPWSGFFVTPQFSHYRDQAGLPDTLVLHSLRHSFSTHLREAGVHTDTVSPFLQHSSVAMTRHYDHSTLVHFRDSLGVLDLGLVPKTCKKIHQNPKKNRKKPHPWGPEKMTLTQKDTGGYKNNPLSFCGLSPIFPGAQKSDS